MGQFHGIFGLGAVVDVLRKWLDNTTTLTIQAARAFSITYAYTSAVDVTDYAAVDLFITLTDKGTNTTFSVQAQTTEETETSGQTWANVPTDVDLTSAGVTTVPVYTATITPGTPTPANPEKFHLRFRGRGRQMRFGILGDTAPDGSYTVTAIRKAR